MLKEFAARFTVALSKNNLTDKTQKQLAEEFGVTASAIGFWSTGKTRPNRRNALKLAERLGVNVEWLLHGKGEMVPPGAASPAGSPKNHSRTVLIVVRGAIDQLKQRLFATSEHVEVAASLDEPARFAYDVVNMKHIPDSTWLFAPAAGIEKNWGDYCLCVNRDGDHMLLEWHRGSLRDPDTGIHVKVGEWRIIGVAMEYRVQVKRG